MQWIRYVGHMPIATPGHPLWHPGEQREVSEELAQHLVRRPDFEAVEPKLAKLKTKKEARTV